MGAGIIQYMPINKFTNSSKITTEKERLKWNEMVTYWVETVVSYTKVGDNRYEGVETE